MMQISETEAFRACRILFGSDLRLSRDFLLYLQSSGAHSAFRKRAKATHPDSCHNQPLKKHRQIRLFQDLNQAHQLIQNYLRQRDLLTTRSHTGTSSRRSNRGATTGHKHPYPKQPAQGPLPTRPLQFGTYLYYRGMISFNSLIWALNWQRRQRPTAGQIAQRWGWLKEQEVGEILTCRKTGRFGERAEQLGLLSSLQVRAILLHQRSQQSKLGDYFVEQGLLTMREIERLLGELAEHNLKYRHGYPHHYYYHHR